MNILKKISKIFIYQILIYQFFLSIFLYASDIPLEYKIGQMIIIGTNITKPNQAGFFQLAKWIEKGYVGGIILFEKNIQNYQQAKILISALKKIKSPYPLFIAIDQEGGYVQRLKQRNGFYSYPSSAQVSKLYSLKEAQICYEHLAYDLADIGINLNFGPVVDLNINKDCPVIGKLQRSYSSDSQVVINYATVFINAHKKYNILTTLKHFPGHGSSTYDSHLGATDITNTWQDKELIPFKDLIVKNQAQLIMTAHIINKNIDSKPITFSSIWLKEILRKKLGFDGVIVSDDLSMGAISKYYPLKDIIIKSIHAGINILLFSNNLKTNKYKLSQIIKIIKQEIPSQEINNSFLKIIKLKANLQN